MPRSREQNKQIRDERRRSILEAAIPLFARNGFSQTSISAVAKAAGVSHGTVFLYFSTKEKLYHAAVVEPLEEATGQFHALLKTQDSPLERINRMARDHIAALAHKADYLRMVQHVLGQPERFPEIAERLFAFSAEHRDTLAEVIREGQQAGELGPGYPEGTALAYFAYMNGVGLVILDRPDHPIWETLLETGIRLFNPLRP